MSNELTVYLPNADATIQLARQIAAVLRAGDWISLNGPLGAGKTELARAIIQTRQGVDFEDVPSPTFTLVQTYQTPGLEIWHADLYRLSDPMEVIELGLFDARDNAAVLVEWPQRLGALCPKDVLDIQLSYEGNGRQARLNAAGSWCDRIPAMTDIGAAL